MKKSISVLSLLVLFFTGCESTFKTKWAGGGAVHSDYTVLSQNTYSIMASGALACEEEDVLSIWKWRVDEIVDGREHEIQYDVIDPNPYTLAGIKVVGTVTIKTDDTFNPPNNPDLPVLAENKKDQATVYLINGSGGAMAGKGNLVFIDDSPLVRVSKKQYTWFYRDAGEINVRFTDPSMKKRTLSARNFQIENGKTYYLTYKPGSSGKSDGQLLLDIISGAAKGKEEFSKEDLKNLSYNEAMYLIGWREFVPSSIDEDSNKSVLTTPEAAPPTS